MPRPDNKLNKTETMPTPIVDEVYTDEDIVRQHEDLFKQLSEDKKGKYRYKNSRKYSIFIKPVPRR